MPNIKGPWFTPVSSALRMKPRSSATTSPSRTRRLRQRRQAGEPALQSGRAEGQGHPTGSGGSGAFNGVVRQAKEANIPIVGAGSPIVASTVEADAAASSSHCSIGHELAKGAKTLLPNGGTIAMLAARRARSGPLTFALLQGRHRRQQDQDRRRADQRAGCRRLRSRSPTTSCSAFPTSNLLYGADDTYGVGAARAAQGASKCGKVKILFAVLGEAAEEMMNAAAPTTLSRSSRS